MGIHYTEQQKEAIGKAVAALFGLKYAKGHKGLYITQWGMKTDKGLYNVVARLGSDIESGKIFTTLEIYYKGGAND